MRRIVLVASLLLPVLLGATSARGDDSRAPERLRALLASKGPAAGKYGVVVVDVPSAEELFGVDASVPRIPASTMKLVTTGATLVVRGKDSKLVTRVLAGARPGPDGVLRGDLVLRGGGDPTLDEAAFADLARQVADAGVRRIAGDLVADDGLFDRELRHPSWPADQLERSYCAPVTALTVNRSCVTVTVRPGAAAGARARIEIRPPGHGLRVKNSITTCAEKKDQKIVLSLKPDGDVLVAKGQVWRKVDGFPADVAAPDPTLLAAGAFRYALVGNGIALGGGIVARRDAAAALAEPVVLAEHGTAIVDVVRETNRESVNLYADCLLKGLAAAKGETGSFGNGAEVAAGLAERMGLSTRHVSQADGSGLSRENLVTPTFLARLLVLLYREEGLRADFMLSLATGGAPDGTLDDRLKDLGRNVAAKTGTIRAVSALAGYVRGESGRVVAFAVLVNDPKMPLGKARELQDGICRILRKSY